MSAGRVDGGDLDRRIGGVARGCLEEAAELLRDLIRVPADRADRPPEEGGDPLCGLSNHEGPRLELLRRRIVELGAVDGPDDVALDRFGNLRWSVSDPDDGVPEEERTVVWLDGHTDTVQPLTERWLEASGGGLHPHLGLLSAAALDRDRLRRELGYLPPDEEWDELVWGRGSADQLGGVVCQVMATRLLRRLRDAGALSGVTVVSYATVAEEDNDGGGPMYVVRHELPGAGPGRIPDAVVLTEGTGAAEEGVVGIYRGQRGRMQIEVEVTGRSCHGSMPWEGLNPLEHGGAILAAAAAQAAAGKGFGDDPFLGPGSRTASSARLETPSDCAVPDRFTFRFDRRLTAGEDPGEALAAIERLESVALARREGLRVAVRVPTYDEPTWRGYSPGNAQIYPGWVTPAEHPAIDTAVDTYRRVVSPFAGRPGMPAALPAEPRVSRWVFSTDGVGLPVPRGFGLPVPERKGWVEGAAFRHPPMFGIGPGVEQNTHKIGECVDRREMVPVIAFLARFPSLYRAARTA